MTIAQALRPGTLSQEQLLDQLIAYPDYRTPKNAPAGRFDASVRRLWGGSFAPMMASAETRGRFSGAPLACPPTACTGSLVLGIGAKSETWRNPDAIECLVCIDGVVEVRYGPDLARSIRLGKYDMLSVPADVRHAVSNTGRRMLASSSYSASRTGLVRRGVRCRSGQGLLARSHRRVGLALRQ